MYHKVDENIFNLHIIWINSLGNASRQGKDNYDG